MSAPTTSYTCKACGHPTEPDSSCQRHKIAPLVLPDGTDISGMQGHTMAILGKPLVNCTREDLDTITRTLYARAAAETADADRADAAIREAAECGCERFRVPVDAHGRPDVGRAQVVHTCGRRR